MPRILWYDVLGGAEGQVTNVSRVAQDLTACSAGF